jgi:hypothetical protein
MEKLVQQNPLVSSPLSPLSPITSTQTHSIPPKNGKSPRLSETSEVVVYPSSVSLRVSINKKIFFQIFFLLFSLSTRINSNVGRHTSVRINTY